METNPWHWGLVGAKCRKKFWTLKRCGLDEIATETVADCYDAMSLVCRFSESEEVVQVRTKPTSEVHAT